MESIIEILNNASKKWGIEDQTGVKNFKQLIDLYNRDGILELVRLVSKTERNKIKSMYSKSEVINLLNKFNNEVTIGGKSELKDKHIGSLTYPELQQKWIEDNV